MAGQARLNLITLACPNRKLGSKVVTLVKKWNNEQCAYRWHHFLKAPQKGTVQLFLIVPMNNSCVAEKSNTGTCPRRGVSKCMCWESMKYPHAIKSWCIMGNLKWLLRNLWNSLTDRVRAWPPASGLSWWAATVGMLWAPTSLPWSDRPLEALKALNSHLIAGYATVRLTSKECKEESDVKGDMETVPATTGSSTPFIQINLHHSNSASPLLAKNMAVMQTGIAIVQEPWGVKGVIKGLGSCVMVYRADTTDKIWGCIFAKGTRATLLPQFSCSYLVVIQTKLQLVIETDRDAIAGSIYIYTPWFKGLATPRRS